MMDKIIDFERLGSKGEKRLLTGRSNGQTAYEFYGLDKFDASGTLVFKSSEDLVVSNSYFLGMLQEIFIRYQEVNELYKHIDSDGLSLINKDELVRSIRRGFAKNTSPIG